MKSPIENKKRKIQNDNCLDSSFALLSCKNRILTQIRTAPEQLSSLPYYSSSFLSKNTSAQFDFMFNNENPNDSLSILKMIWKPITIYGSCRLSRYNPNHDAVDARQLACGDLVIMVAGNKSAHTSRL